VEPTREIYWNIRHGWLLYPLALLVAVVLVGGLWRRWRVWRRGRLDPWRDDLPRRLRAALTYGLGQAKVVRSPFAGTMHLLLYAGFATLLLGTLMIAVQEDLRVPFLHGAFYLGYSLVLDLFGAVALVGVAGLAWRRYIQRPSGLDRRPEDAVVLTMLAVLLVTGYLIEGLRIGATELHDDPALARWSPLGLLTAQLLIALGLPSEAFRPLHAILWWGHGLLALVFLGYWGWSKMRHVLLAPATAFLHPGRPFGALPPITDFKDPRQLGAGTFADLTFRQRLSADTCIHAGRCQDNCPAHLSGKPLNPKALIVNLQHLAARAQGVDRAAVEATPLTAALSEEGVWACTTCGACTYHCPVLVEPMEAILAMRRHLVLTKGQLPPTAQAALLNLQKRGHPWSGTRLTRTDWLAGLDVPLLADRPQAAWLFWVGCSGALVERNVQTTRALARLLHAAGVDFAVLGDEETCTGDPARRLGNEFLYQVQARKNLQTFARYGVRRIVTACPHCFHTLRHEYAALGGQFEVVHHTQLLAELVATGQLAPRQELAVRLTYHDPCYLGRYNRVYGPPRDVVDALPGVQRVEMPRCREKGFCCGAGGGHAWLEERGGARINHLRTREALDTGAAVLATACPFCLQMFEEATKAVEGGARLQALDVAELLERSLAPPSDP
jgi:Fe-S oxidoreductase/nitrate reductase gamma subunit